MDPEHKELLKDISRGIWICAINLMGIATFIAIHALMSGKWP